MKTITKIFALMLLSCTMLVDLPVQAQFTHFPTYNAPIFGQANVSHGLLDPLDQSKSPIWFKVNGNIVGPQPHNKMHPYVTPGSEVQVNFNINKNNSNRYSLVSYTVSNTGVRKLYDYHSNHFNQSSPVQGNSNQQLVLIPTCRFEVYFVKGAISLGWNGPVPAGVYNPATDPANPYTNDLQNVIPAGLDNRILDFAYGGTGECNTCPFVLVPNPNPYSNCVYPRLLEVIDLPASGQKELLFSVANTINTDANGCGTLWPEIGDIIFTNLFPSHTGNNQPYQFRYNYQLGPNIPNYALPPTMPPQSSNPVYQGAFVFDQRNNHNNWDYDVYQSEIVRYKVSNAEYARLNTPGLAPKPQICIELSDKHPEPHTTLEPVYCFNIEFNCAPVPGLFCVESPSASGGFVANIPTEFVSLANGNFEIPINIYNFTNTGITSIDFSIGAPILAPTSGPYSSTFNYTVANNNAGSAIFTGTNTATNFLGGASDQFTLTVNALQLISSGAVLTINIHAGATTETLVLEAGESGQINPLPVELLDFTGTLVSEGVNLKWNTASEKNNDHFTIERSFDGKNFEKIGTQKGQGTTSALSTYKFTDKHYQKGINYYRLNQIDLDGKNAYSHIVKVNAEKGALALGVQLIPNPCSNENCSVLLQGVDTSKSLVVEMKDLSGRIVFRQEIPADQQSFNLPKAKIGKGVYVLSAKNGQNITYQKVIIQ